MPGHEPSMNVRPPESPRYHPAGNSFSDNKYTNVHHRNIHDHTAPKRLIQMTNMSIMRNLQNLSRDERGEIKTALLNQEPRTPTDGNLTEDPNSSDSFIQQIAEMDNWSESDPEHSSTYPNQVGNTKYRKYNGFNQMSSPESYIEEPSTNDISVINLDSTQETISPNKFTELPVPKCKSGKERKKQYAEILSKLRKETPKSERKRNIEGDESDTSSAKKRKLSPKELNVESIITKIKDRKSKPKVTNTFDPTVRKPLKLPEVLKMPEVILPPIFGNKQVEKKPNVKQKDKAKSQARYPEILSPIELTRSHRTRDTEQNVRDIQPTTGKKDTERRNKNATPTSKEGNRKSNQTPKIRPGKGHADSPAGISFDTEFLELQQQYELDERAREQYIKDMQEYRDICQGEIALKKGRRQCGDAWNLFGKGKASNIKDEQLSKQIMLLGGDAGIIDQWDYALTYDHTDLPDTVEEINKKIESSERNKNALTTWFGHKDHTVVKHSKKQYVSALFASAFAGLTVIANIMDHKTNTRVIEYGFVDKESHKELKLFREKMEELSKFATNGKRILSLWQSFPILLSNVIPVPPSLRIAKLVLDNFSLEQSHVDFPATSQNKTILRYLLRRLGIETIEKRYESDVIRMVTNITGTFEPQKVPILIATKNSSKSVPKVSTNHDLIRETITWIISTNTELEPHEIDLKNLKNVRKTKKGKILLNEFAKIAAYEPEGLAKLLNINFANKVFSNRINVPVQEANPTNLKEEQIRRNNLSRLDIIEGRIPIGPLDPNTIQPGPELFIKDLHGKQTMIINDLKAKLGNKNRVSAKTITKFKKLAKTKPTNQAEMDDFATKAIKTGITNPSDEDIEQLFKTARDINENKAANNEKIKVLSTNPGKACSRTLREIADAEPLAHIYCLNELQIKTETLLDGAIWPPEHTVYSNSASKDGMSYTAIMVKDNVKHRISVAPAPGNCTAIDLKINEKITKRYVSTYRHNNKDPPLCYYYKNWNKDKYIFVEWIREIVRRAKQDKVQLVLCGDWNICLTKHRGQDDLDMVEGLKNAVRSLVNLVVGNTHFRPNVSPSEIDVFFVSHPAQSSCVALNLHRPPCSFDGHTGHMATMPFEKPLIQYEVKVSQIVDKDEMYQYMIDNYEKHKHRIDQEQNNEAKVSLSFNIINEALEKCSKRVGKISQKGAGIFTPTPKDTWKYREAANMIADEFERRSKNPEQQDPEKMYVLRINLIKISVMCKKFHARDSLSRTNKIVNRLETSNPVNFWETVNSLLSEPPVRELENNVQKHIEEVIKLQQTTATSPENYKGHTFKPLHKVKLSKFKTSLHGNKTHSSILKTFKTLKHYTKGHTGISRSTLDTLPIGCFRMLIYEPIMTAINDGLYPEVWRCNRTQILPKPKGIRPLSIQEIYATIIEKLIIDQINNFLEHNNFMHTSQNGFRRNLSTASSLATVINYIARRRSEGYYVVISALDAKNAFGSPPHESLTKCLSQAFEGKALKLLGESLARDAIVANKGFSQKNAN
ncbi:unnamed protein product [Oikopleura dioica]|uniref:Uncharacterized protein n=1 Tax=Oikopleura dioica TaxID=34765 RepID=E4X1W8_OIKDI|nr:unnamed protein product [Oikopleura dioica]